MKKFKHIIIGLLIALIILLIVILIFQSNNNKESNVKESNVKDTSEEENLKPVIYLYPEAATDISVGIDYKGDLTCTYPRYNDCWNVHAEPSGRLTNYEDGKEYSYLYWEGICNFDYNFNKGFVIEGDRTVEFLQEKLSYMGLEPREYNEFIVFWLPKMEHNEYNLIYFAEDEYKEIANLTIKPRPD